MIPPGTAVRDAHACYEVVVPVTVPNKPRLAPAAYYYHYPPIVIHISANTNEIPLRGIVGEYGVRQSKRRQMSIKDEKSHWEEVEGGVDEGWPLAGG